MGKTLIIAEKYSVAKEIAHVVGARQKVVESKDARYGYFEGNSYCVSWCYGHLLSLYYPEDYDEDLKSWSVKGLPYIPSEWKYSVVVATKKQYSVLKKLLHSSEISDVICATDADREGELIFRLVYNSLRSSKPVKRLWVSSMEDAAIKAALKKMKDMKEYDSLFHAASARQKADWIVGLNATRYFTCRYSKYPEIVNIGRVQTPTVNLIVQRQKDIDNFVPKAYYVLTADTGTFKARLQKEDKASADSLIKKCNGKSGFIDSIKKEKKKTDPPELYSLTVLQQEADKMFGMSATETLNTVQSLYEKKILTYPRTDSQYLTSDMKESTSSIIDGFLAKDDFIHPTAKAVLQARKPNVDIVINDKKVSGHHAIIPTATSLAEDISALKLNEQRIFKMVLYRLLAAVAPKYEYLSTKVVLNVQGERFTANGNQPLVGGWRDVIDSMKASLESRKKSEQENKKDEEDETQTLPDLHEGDTFDKIKVTGQEKFTTPPPAYTEASLLKEMQNIGKKIEDEDLRAVMSKVDDNGNPKMLGTSATQGSIIDKIIKSGYVYKNGRKFVPTEKAYKLIELVPEEIKSPIMTAEWERTLEDIKDGTKTEDAFINEISVFIKNVISDSEAEYLKNSSDEKTSSQITVPSSISFKCPKCGNDLQDKGKLYSCVSSSCDFVIWKTIAQKNLTTAQIKKLLEKGSTDLIKGFTSKAGKSFNAYLVLDDDGKIKFEFKKQ